MNLTKMQILARNLFANTTGIDDLNSIEAAFATWPTVEQTMLQTLSQAFTGPFGDVELSHDCNALDGYLVALEDVSQVVIANGGYITPSDLETLRRDVTYETPTLEPTGAEALAALFSQIFGRPVRVVQA